MDAPQYLPYRRSIRLPTYDYAQAGAYFTTFVTAHRLCFLGEILNGEMVLSSFGQIVQEEWLRSGERRAEVTLDAFVVMPNHVHGIIILDPTGPGGESHGAIEHPFKQQPRSLGSLVAGLKGASTTRINTLRNSPGLPVWQRNYYEHVIRNETDLQRIRGYIEINPAKWEEDAENPAAREGKTVGGRTAVRPYE